MPRTLEPSREFSRHHRPDRSRGERDTWGCGDERYLKIAGAHLLHRAKDGAVTTILDRRDAPRASVLYKQTIAGAYGVGQDAHIALRMARHRRHGEDAGVRRAERLAAAHASSNVPEQARRALPNAAILGSVITKAARPRGIDLLMHIGCAGEVAAPDIDWGIAQNRGPNGEDIYETIKRAYQKDGKRATLPKSRFDQISEMHAESLEEGMIAQIEEVTRIFDQGAEYRGDLLVPVGRLALVNHPHIGDTMSLEWRKDTAFDVEAAFNASKPAEGEIHTRYNASMGDMPDIHEIVEDLFQGVNPQDFLDAAFVRNGASSLFLPPQSGAAPTLQAVYA
jgi:hypothetical protein